MARKKILICLYKQLVKWQNKHHRLSYVRQTRAVRGSDYSPAIVLSEEKDKWQIKGRIRSSSLIPVYTIHLPTVHVCTKFQTSRPHSSWEKCDKKLQCLKIGEKENWRNKGLNMQKHPDSGIHDTSPHCPRVYQVSIF